ncbi:MAG: ribonuclease P protein component [Chroococcidiopsidaceae cyanobacterium CP_BM_RX_35]|nr:ribonuclease P protein component [Chroococcidiopsidaceae cyanobacterium CP_BM_RX_35]
MALPKANRLQHRQDFREVFRDGIRRNSSHLTLRALPSQPEIPLLEAVKATPPTRIGISISLKVSKRAVIRNRIKRQIQAAFRQLLLRTSPGWRLVVVVQPSAVQECDYHQFLQELEQLLAEAEVLNGYS